MHDDGSRFIVIKVKGNDGRDALLRLIIPTGRLRRPWFVS
jgi:hypothetical protein